MYPPGGYMEKQDTDSGHGQWTQTQTVDADKNGCSWTKTMTIIIKEIKKISKEIYQI